jgi:hypothetical protein
MRSNIGDSYPYQQVVTIFVGLILGVYFILWSEEADSDSSVTNRNLGNPYSPLWLVGGMGLWVLISVLFGVGGL